MMNKKNYLLTIRMEQYILETGFIMLKRLYEYLFIGLGNKQTE